MEILVYSDRFGAPGAVRYMKCVTPGPIASWPSFSRHTFPVEGWKTGDAWWVGYLGDWEGSVQGWYIGADTDGFDGCPMTKIAPGLGYPSGWQSVSVVWEPTKALGIGAEVHQFGTKRGDTTWSKIERVTR